jgi:hypothetical protein
MKPRHLLPPLLPPPRASFRLLVLAGLWLCTACQPDDQKGTVTAQVFALDPATRTYGLQKLPVENLESLRELRGRNVEVRRGAEITLGLEGEPTIDRGAGFSLEFTLDEDGTVIPGDLHSLYALSLYRALDRVASLLRSHGHAPLRRLDVFYYPRLDSVLLGDQRSGLTDNAAYASFIPGFLVVPSFMLDDLPMLLNEGVVAHEFGHAVIHQELFGSASEATGEGLEGWALAHRHLESMHEAGADLIGLIATGDPDFIRPTADVGRNLAEPIDYTYEDLAEIEDLSEENTAYDPHRHGSILGRALYEMWPKQADGTIPPADLERLLDVLLASLRSLKADFGQQFNLADLAEQMVSRLQSGEQPHACAVLLSRLEPLSHRLPTCAGGR